MKKKLTTLAIALGLSIAVLTGCGKTAAEPLADDMSDSEIESQTVEVEVSDDEGYHDGYVTLNMNNEFRTFLCNVKVPEGFTYNDDVSFPETGYFILGCDEGGHLLICNWARDPLYDYLVYGSIPDDPEYSDYTDYTCERKVIGTVHNADCVLIHETYYDEEYEESVDNIYCVIQYDDGGLIEFITVRSELWEEDNYTNDDWLNLMKEMFE